MRGGRTKPLVVDCESSEGSSVRRQRFVVKALGLPEVQEFTLCHELFGSCLAKLTGVNVPTPALIDISEAFVAANEAVLASDGLRLSSGLAVGSSLIRGLTPMPRNVTLRPEDLEDAAGIYALDMAIQNPDRSALNPNCGFAEGRIVAYDFESAFSFRFLIGPRPAPWEVKRFGFQTGHAFFNALRRQPVNWAPLLERWDVPITAELSALCATIPEGWRSPASDILQHLDDVLEHREVFADELRGSLL